MRLELERKEWFSALIVQTWGGISTTWVPPSVLLLYLGPCLVARSGGLSSTSPLPPIGREEGEGRVAPGEVALDASQAHPHISLT